MPEVAYAQAVDEDAHVRPQPVLLIDDAKAQPGVAAFEVKQQRSQRLADGLDVLGLRVGPQRPWNQHLHRAALTCRFTVT